MQSTQRSVLNKHRHQSYTTHLCDTGNIPHTWYGHWTYTYDIDGLVQDCSNSSALTMELLQSYTKPSIWARWYTQSQKSWAWISKHNSQYSVGCNYLTKSLILTFNMCKKPEIQGMDFTAPNILCDVITYLCLSYQLSTHSFKCNSLYHDKSVFLYRNINSFWTLFTWVAANVCIIKEWQFQDINSNGKFSFWEQTNHFENRPNTSEIQFW